MVALAPRCLPLAHLVDSAWQLESAARGDFAPGPSGRRKDTGRGLGHAGVCYASGRFVLDSVFEKKCVVRCPGLDSRRGVVGDANSVLVAALYRWDGSRLATRLRQRPHDKGSAVFRPPRGSGRDAFHDSRPVGCRASDRLGRPPSDQASATKAIWLDWRIWVVSLSSPFPLP